MTTTEKPVLVLFIDDYPQCFYFANRSETLAWADDALDNIAWTTLSKNYTSDQLATPDAILRQLKTHLNLDYGTDAPVLHWQEVPLAPIQTYDLTLSIEHREKSRQLVPTCTSTTFPWPHEIGGFCPAIDLPRAATKGRLVTDEVHGQVALDNFYSQLVDDYSLANGYNSDIGLKLSEPTASFVMGKDETCDYDRICTELTLTPRTFKELGLDLPAEKLFDV